MIYQNSAYSLYNITVHIHYITKQRIFRLEQTAQIHYITKQRLFII